jgi:hypothetical protein
MASGSAWIISLRKISLRSCGRVEKLHGRYGRNMNKEIKTDKGSRLASLLTT